MAEELKSVNLAAAPVVARWSLAPVLGLVLTCLGLMVITGWLLQVRAMVEIRSGLVAMTVNTALCFTLSGLALLMPAILNRRLPRWQGTVGLFLIGLSSLILIEHLTDTGLGVDWAFMHTWLHDGNIRPGRLAPNTAIGFMLAGGCLLLLSRITRHWQERLFQILLFSLLVVGLTGLIGYVLSPDQLFGWARSARMAIHTAVGMILLATALWSSWNAHGQVQAAGFLAAEEKIAFMSAAILCVVTLASGLTGFVFQQTILENALRDKLQFRLNDQIGLFKSILVRAGNLAESAAEDERLFDAAEHLALDSSNTAARNAFMVEIQRLLHNGFQSATLLTPDGHVLYAPGGQTEDKPITGILSGTATMTQPKVALLDLPGNIRQQAALLWDGQLRLRTDGKLARNEHVFARLVLYQHLPVLQTQLFDLHGLGQTGELALCSGQGDKLLCLPSGRQSTPYLIRRTNFTGQPLPMNYAVNGETGLIATFDYKGNNVMAAYAPVAPNLGLVVKQDTAELYAVIRTQLKFVIPALLLLTLLGAWLMRSQIRPLAQRLSDSENQARERQLEINTVVNSVGEGIMTINEDGIIESFNAAAADIFGYATHEVIGQPLQMLMPPALRGQHEAGMREYLRGGNPKVIGRPKLEMPGLRRDGSEFTLELTVNEIRFASRRVFVGVVRDITERKQFEEKLIFLAQYDVLTGLPNRALFMDRLSGAMLRASRNRTALAVMFLDLDGFKSVNDTLGHHSGDALLRQFGGRLSMAVRKTDSVARLAGDEFTVILEGLRDPEHDTREVAEKIIATMEAHFELGEHQVRVTTSIGLAIHAGGEVDMEILLRRADDAMYRAKQSGKNRWCV